MDTRGLTVADVVQMVEAFAPPNLAEEWDPAGLQAGHPAWGVTGVLAALDVTREVVDEAARKGLNMIVAHHPILFKGTRTLREDEPSGALAAALIRGGIALYTSHTALDEAPGGVMDELCARVGLSDVQRGEMCRIASFSGGTAGALLGAARKGLAWEGVALYGNSSSPVRRVAVCSGSGMSYLLPVTGVDAYLTGDVTHHAALDALAAGIAVVDVGHRGGERVAVDVLMCGLQKRMGGVECPVRVCASEVDPYAIVTGQP